MQRAPLSGRLALASVGLALALCAAAQTPRQQAEKELSRKMPAGTFQACSLVTRADVRKAIGRDPYVDPEPFGNNGWICNIGVGEIKLYSGPNSWEQWEATLKGFSKENDPKTPAPGFGQRAYFLYPKPDNKFQGSYAFLVAQQRAHTVAVSLEAPEGRPSESMRPALEALMKTILERLP